MDETISRVGGRRLCNPAFNIYTKEHYNIDGIVTNNFGIKE